VIAIPYADPQGYASIPTHAETEQHLFEVVTTVFAMPVGRPRRPRHVRFVLIGPIEGNRSGILMQPGRRKGIDLQGFEGDRTKHRVEIGRKQRIEDMSQAGIMERGTRESRLQQRHHATLFEPSPYLVEGMMPIQNREHQGFDPTPTGEPMRRVGRDEAVDHGRHLQAP
jgi:hypothetical protein